MRNWQPWTCILTTSTGSGTIRSSTKRPKCNDYCFTGPELEPADFGFEFGYAELFTRYRVLLEGFPAVVGRGPDAGLAAGVVDIQAGIEVSLEIAEDRRDLVRPGSFSHGSLPGSLPVVRFPLWLDQVLGAGHAPAPGPI